MVGAEAQMVSRMTETVSDVSQPAFHLASTLSLLSYRNELFAALVESSNDGIMALTLDGRISSWNQGAEQIYGYSAEETIGRPITILMPPERAAKFIFGSARRRQNTERFDVVHQHKDGRRIDVAVTVSPIRDAGQATVGYSAIIRDVTLRRRLAQERDQLAAIVAATHDSIIGWTPDGTITSWNPASERLYGYSAVEAIGKPMLMLVPPDGIDNWHKTATDLRAGNFFVGHETVRMHKDGRRIAVSMTVSPIYSDGAVTAFATIARDITEARRAQEQAAVRSRQLQALATLGHDGLMATDLQELMQRAVELVVEGLGTEFANVLELDAARQMLVHRAGWGWKRDYVGQGVIPADSRFLAGYTLPEAPRVVTVPDFTKETRFLRSPVLIEHKVMSSMGVVIPGEGDRPFGVLGTHSTRPRTFSQQDSDFIQNVAHVIAAALQRRRAEEQQELMLSELEHRVKNTLAVVQAIVSITARNAQSTTQLVSALSGRIEALARGHTLLTGQQWAACDLRDLIELALDPYRRAAPDAVSVDGPRLQVRPRAALALAMILHELATNAAKYGALSSNLGRLDILWETVQSDGKERVQLRWTESGLDGIAPPSREGFGTTLITRSIGMALSGTATFDYTPTGLHCILVFSPA
jgi:PAS domain S-box-containing protein